jgi:hypothetical protein
VTAPPISTLLLRNALPMRNGPRTVCIIIIIIMPRPTVRGSIVDEILVLISSLTLSLLPKRLSNKRGRHDIVHVDHLFLRNVTFSQRV